MAAVRLLILIALSAIIFGALLWRQLTLEPVAYGYDEVDGTAVLQPLLLTILTVIGILSKSIWDAMTRERDKEPSFGLKIAEGLALDKLTLALLISPIVIFTFYEKLNEIDDIVLLCLMAYQNGFFWETVLPKRSKEGK